MTAHDPAVIQTARLVSGKPPPVAHSLESLDILRLAHDLVVFTPRGDEIAALLDIVRVDLPQIAALDVVHRVVSHNPDSLWGIARRARFNATASAGEGLLAFLMLNEEGLRQLVAGTFDASDPDLSLLVSQNEKPAGIYVWCCHAKGSLAAAVPLALQKVWSPLYRDVDLYTRSINAPAIRFVERMGFRREARYAGFIAPHLHVYHRSPPPPDAIPAYDSRSAPTRPDRLSVGVVHSLDDVMRVVAVRSAVYLAEQRCPYAEEFDGNDFAATHLLGYVGDEPAGCVRIRFFAGFAKIERFAVRSEFRHTRLAFRLIRAAVDLCRKKGYQRLYGHAQKRLAHFWSRFGFHELEDSREFTFSDFGYVEMVLDTDPAPDPVTIGTDPFVIIRPEGRWHVPGILEQSAKRPAKHSAVVGNAP